MGGHLSTTTFHFSTFPYPHSTSSSIPSLLYNSNNNKKKTKEMMMMKKPQAPLLIFFFLYVLLLTAKERKFDFAINFDLQFHFLANLRLCFVSPSSASASPLSLRRYRWFFSLPPPPLLFLSPSAAAAGSLSLRRWFSSLVLLSSPLILLSPPLVLLRQRKKINRLLQISKFFGEFRRNSPNFRSLLTARAQDAAAAGFKCSSPTTTKCDALIDYVAPNATTLSDIKTLFGVHNLRSILGANSLLLSTPPNQTVAAKQTIKVPFECVCDKGRGVSNKRPVYKVKAGDGLDHIARDVFSALVTYQQIQAFNDIKNASLILVGQELRIPLPCSCDDVDGMEVVHYGHVVASGSSVEQIAEEYGTKEDTLLRLNGLADPKLLMAGSVLDVPLRACASSVSNQSRDYPLRVSNGTYVFTAHNCVQCNCDSSNNWTLQCNPSPPGIKVSNWDKCPSMTCQGTDNLSIGNSSSSSSSCETTTCSYAGYDDKALLTTLTKTSTCNVQGAPGPGNYATKIGLQGFSWSWVLPSANLGLLCLGYLW